MFPFRPLVLAAAVLLSVDDCWSSTEAKPYYDDSGVAYRLAKIDGSSLPYRAAGSEWTHYSGDLCLFPDNQYRAVVDSRLSMGPASVVPIYGTYKFTNGSGTIGGTTAVMNAAADSITMNEWLYVRDASLKPTACLRQPAP
jgi:hypothetical protein